MSALCRSSQETHWQAKALPLHCQCSDIGKADEAVIPYAISVESFLAK
jgi:hypothetical protein